MGWRKTFFSMFMGAVPDWYKGMLLIFLAMNLVISLGGNPKLTGWVILGQFLVCLAMAKVCHPVTGGGLLVVQAVVLGLANPVSIMHETHKGLKVLLMVTFMVAAIHFLRKLLRKGFMWIILRVKSKVKLAVLLCCMTALSSAFLDALTVTAVVATVLFGLYLMYEAAKWDLIHPELVDEPDTIVQEHEKVLTKEEEQKLSPEDREILDQYRAYLRSIAMHALVGTMLGGVVTLIGEPQNYYIGEVMKWNFKDFFMRMAPVTIPVLFTGLFISFAVQYWPKFGRYFGHGVEMPQRVRELLEKKNTPIDEMTLSEGERNAYQNEKKRETLEVLFQGIAAICIVLGLLLHVAEVFLIGLGVLVFVAAMCGETAEEKIAEAFHMAMPFVALLVVFYGVVVMIEQQHLFASISEWILSLKGKMQLLAFYFGTGGLSVGSDNVFVATIFMNLIEAAFKAGLMTQEQFEHAAVAINTGTNIPSIGLPSGQAAFLFFLTSEFARKIDMGFGKMARLALPWTIACTLVGAIALMYSL